MTVAPGFSSGDKGRMILSRLVERRVGYAFTFNLANRWSWIFLLALLAAPPIVIFLIR